MISVNQSKHHQVHAKYMIVFLLTVLGVLLPVFVINFVIDPGEIYLQRILNARYTQNYVTLLLNSSTGVRLWGNERLVKYALAKKAGDFDNIILGSSHSMQLNRLRMPQFSRCFVGRMLNLGVSGGSLEDIMIFSYIILHNQHMPKALLIELSPWCLKWGMDVRYKINEIQLNSMRSDLDSKAGWSTEPYWLQLLGNGFSIDYFKESIKLLRDHSFKLIQDDFFKDYEEVRPFNYDEGYKFQVYLNDGSVVNPKSNSMKDGVVKHSIQDMGESNYKLAGNDYDENAIVVFEKLIDMIRRKNIKVYFFLAPYNPIIFRSADGSQAKHLARVEKRIREIAKKMNIIVFGSYDPRENNLTEEDFFDIMHARAKGLDKISFNH